MLIRPLRSVSAPLPSACRNTLVKAPFSQSCSYRRACGIVLAPEGMVMQRGTGVGGWCRATRGVGFDLLSR